MSCPCPMIPRASPICRTTRAARGQQVLRRPRRALVVTHRWIALTLGLLLVVVSTSGALIVYEPELLRASNAELFHATLDTALDDAPVGFSAAMDAVAGADPEFSAADASLEDGVYLVSSADGDGQTYFVDAGSGVVNGQNNLSGGVVGFLENLHDCALTCEEFAGYVSWLAGPSPLAGFTLFSEMNWGAMLLAVAGLALVFLAVSAPFSGGRVCASGATPFGSAGVGGATPGISTCTMSSASSPWYLC
jgi:PepSY-associated TM region